MATGVLALAGAIVSTAPAANAQETTWTSKCVNQIATGLDIPPSETKVDVTVSPVKDVYTVGDLVTVSWKWKSYSKVPNAGLPAIPKDSTKPVGNLELTGAQTGTVTVEGPRLNPEAPVGTDLILSDMTGTFTLNAAGTVNLAPKNHRTFTFIEAIGIDAETRCEPLGAAPGTVATLTVQDGQSSGPSLTAPSGEVRPGATIDLSGADYTPNATPHLTLCDAAGNACQTSGFATHTLVVDSAGKLTGTATVSPSASEGPHVVQVTDGTAAGKATITLKNFVPDGPPRAFLSTSSGPLGTVVTVTAENLPPNSNINISALDADQFDLEGFVNLTSLPDGTIPPTEFTVTDPWTSFIRVRAGTDDSIAAILPFHIASAQGTQEPTVTLAPGTLSMSQAGTGIDFGSVTLNGEAQTVEAVLNQVTVTDARGGNLGWSLTGAMTDLVAANGTDKIPAGNLVWTPSCAATPGSLDEVANGTAGPLGSAAAVLCSVAADGGTTGGKFTADAQITLTTPQFAAAGAYSGTLTLTLI
ncbi:WxL domain-containing protein [Streptodolium elevatio]|uniref:WxL domain-containing protein n=1 Tax=Streptodolium elevatio TaxID=3157996 RepID=A0ABV3DW96_9ACTN